MVAALDLEARGAAAVTTTVAAADPTAMMTMITSPRTRPLFVALLARQRPPSQSPRSSLSRRSICLILMSLSRPRLHHPTRMRLVEMQPSPLQLWMTAGVRSSRRRTTLMIFRLHHQSRPRPRHQVLHSQLITLLWRLSSLLSAPTTPPPQTTTTIMDLVHLAAQAADLRLICLVAPLPVAATAPWAILEALCSPCQPLWPNPSPPPPPPSPSR